MYWCTLVCVSDVAGWSYRPTITMTDYLSSLYRSCYLRRRVITVGFCLAAGTFPPVHHHASSFCLIFYTSFVSLSFFLCLYNLRFIRVLSPHLLIEVNLSRSTWFLCETQTNVFFLPFFFFPFFYLFLLTIYGWHCDESRGRVTRLLFFVRSFTGSVVSRF